MATRQTQKGANKMITQTVKDQIIFLINNTDIRLSEVIQKFGLTVNQLKTIRQEYAGTLPAYKK
jgi:hypothetical protein